MNSTRVKGNRKFDRRYDWRRYGEGKGSDRGFVDLIRVRRRRFEQVEGLTEKRRRDRIDIK